MAETTIEEADFIEQAYNLDKAKAFLLAARQIFVVRRTRFNRRCC